jgi:hypothetical protein
MDNNKINQTKCWIATSGHIWMEGYFDTLPVSVRRRLRSSPFNLCALSDRVLAEGVAAAPRVFTRTGALSRHQGHGSGGVRN